MNKVVLGAALAAACFGFSSQVRADVVSVQFALNYSNGGLAPTSSAGLNSQPNYTVTYPANSNPTGTFTDLVNSDNVATTISGSYAAPVFIQNGGTDSTPNQQLFAGAIGEGYDGDNAAGTSISLTGIAYASYNLIVYVQGVRSGTNVTFSVDGGAATTGFNANSGDNSASPVVFTENGNYVEFDGLTGTTLSLAFTNRNSAGDLKSETNAGIAGFQIVSASGGSPVPEPASLGLLAVGALALLKRRK